MEVASMVSPLGINFDSPVGSPYATAPSSPQKRIFFSNFSAPSSPNRATEFFADFHENDSSDSHQFPACIPFDWEEKPGTPKRNDDDEEEEEEDFEFNLGGDLNRTSLSAEELFEKGKIRPLKPPPGYDYSSQASSPRSPTPLLKNDFDPFQAAIEETRRQDRGRERRNSRSLSPLRVSDVLFYSEERKDHSQSKQSLSSSIFSAFSSKTNRKWKLRDLLLFRSASEGRATESRRFFNGDSSMRKFSGNKKENIINDKNCSMRSTGSSGGSFRKPFVSAESHYSMNRAAAGELRKRTTLPYKQGLGCLGFIYPNHSIVHDFSRGLETLTRDQRR